MKKTLLIASAITALFAGQAFAQSASAPYGTPERTQADVKQAPVTGNPANVGGTPAANERAREGRMHESTSGRAARPIENGAPVGSRPQKEDVIKQAPVNGDRSQVGGTGTH